jgi:hypothetical protein
MNAVRPLTGSPSNMTTHNVEVYSWKHGLNALVRLPHNGLALCQEGGSTPGQAQIRVRLFKINVVTNLALVYLGVKSFC